MNGGEIHVVLSLALKMCAEQDTEVLLRPRRRQRTEFFQRLIPEFYLMSSTQLTLTSRTFRPEDLFQLLASVSR